MKAQSPWAWRLCLGAGIALLGLFVISAQPPAPRACGGLDEGYAPIIAFELVRSPADLTALFGATDDACRRELIERLDAVNVADGLVFIPTYAVFLIAFFSALRSRDALRGFVGVGLVALAAAGDYAENLCLLKLTPDLDAGSPWIAALPWATGAKWLSLGVAAAIAAVSYGRRLRSALVRMLAVIPCWTALAGTVAALADPSRFGPSLALSIALSWVVFLVDAAVQVVRSLDRTRPA